jgi:Ca2+/Na+ antiporter
MGIAVLLGCSFFILSVVTAFVVMASAESIKIRRYFFLRDTLSLMFVYLFLLYTILIHQRIDLLVSVMLIVLYSVYVGVVLIQDRFSGS